MSLQTGGARSAIAGRLKEGLGWEYVDVPEVAGGVTITALEEVEVLELTGFAPWTGSAAGRRRWGVRRANGALLRASRRAMIEAVQTVLVLAAFFVLSRDHVGTAHRPGAPPGLSRIGRAVGSSLLVTAIAMTGAGDSRDPSADRGRRDARRS